MSGEATSALRQRYVSDGLWTDDVFPDFLSRWASETPGHAALLGPDGAITYGDLADRAGRLAGGLRRLGLGPGDVIAVQLPNGPDFVATYLAACQIGAVTQTIHMPYHEAELEFLLRHGRARTLVCMAAAQDRSPAASAVALMPALPDLEHVIAACGDTDGAAGLAALADGTALEESATLGGDDRFLLLYTSGTTADPKGVPHRYRGFVYNARASAKEMEFSPDDVALSLAPMSHLYGLFSFHLALISGATTALLPAFSPPAFAATVEACRATKIFAAPAHLAATLNMGLLDAHDFSSVRFIYLSGSVVPPELARAVEDKLPNGITLQLWGMSETQAGAYTRPADP
ncbi:MAG: class I adenylate-forming enzyme family protein, partial [Hyphomicrobiales bacterium]